MQTRSCERPSRAGDPPPLGSPWHLLPPVSLTGMGAGAWCALHPWKQRKNDHVGTQDGDAPAPDEGDEGDDRATRDGDREDAENGEEDEEQKLSDTLIRDLTAHRTLGLRLNLSEQPDVAIVAVTRALAAQIFYIAANAHVVGIQPVKMDLATHAAGIEDTPAGKAWSDRHANWARQMPRHVAKLWEFMAELDHDSRMALFAHCTALRVNAVKLPFDLRPRALAAATRLAEAVTLDMTGYWRPTVRSYLGRVTERPSSNIPMTLRRWPSARFSRLTISGWLSWMLCHEMSPIPLEGIYPESPAKPCVGPDRRSATRPEFRPSNLSGGIFGGNSIET